MIYGSVCSGIEAASAAWHSLGWKAAFVSEIEKFPSQVLAHHYPDVPNLGDMTKYKEWPDAAIDVLVGGTPCQSFSVAGLRGGLDDSRGNLMLTYAEIAHRYRPDWLVWENVPGCLSSAGGADFASLLAVLSGRAVVAPAGGWKNTGIVPGVEGAYGLAWRVLDAQYFGVPQRRRRVFVVGCLGGWQRAAAVLLERQSLLRNPPPRREAGKRVAGTVKGGSGSRGYPDPSDGNGGGLTVAHSLRAQAQASFRADTDTYVPVKWPAEVAPALDTTMKKYMGLDNQHINGGGDGLLPEVANPLTARMHKGVNTTCDEGQTMIPMNGGGFDVAHAIRTAHTLDQAQGQAIAFKANMSVPSVGVGVAETLQAMNPGAVAFDLAQITSKTNRTRVEEGLPASTLNSAGQMHTASSMQVRRLTPMECERLQGFPDGYTLIPVGNKMSADGPRYKALGNSMAVPVMHWIGRRIAFVSKLEGGGK